MKKILSLFFPFLLLAVCLLLSVQVLHAQVASSATITGIQTSASGYTDTPTVSHTVIGTGTNFSNVVDYTISYNEEVKTITSLTAGGVEYKPLNYSGAVTTTLVRNPASGVDNNSGASNNIIYHRIEKVEDKEVINDTYTLYGPYIGKEQDAFNTNNLNVGTDNLFANSGDGNRNNNNVERVDVVFSDGLETSAALAFIVLERGGKSVHDGFKIAAILSVDENGVPTAYGNLVSFGANSYGTTALVDEESDWVVLRNGVDGIDEGDGDPTPPGVEIDGDAIHPSALVTNQTIGGTTVAVSQLVDLGATPTIYGYSIFAYDTDDGGNSANLLDVSNSTYFPNRTSGDTGAGGIDLIAYTGVVFEQVPEPSAGLLLLFGGLARLLIRRRRVV